MGFIRKLNRTLKGESWAAKRRKERRAAADALFAQLDESAVDPGDAAREAIRAARAEIEGPRVVPRGRRPRGKKRRK